MHSTIERKTSRVNVEAPTSLSLSTYVKELKRKVAVLASNTSLLLVPVGIIAVLSLSIMNDKLFFAELLKCSFIVLALLFFKVGSTPPR
jgi:hypothetical protein